MPEVLEVRPLEPRRVWLRFSDGIEGIADLSQYAGKGIFKAWDADECFNRVVVAEGGGIEWPSGIDLCPDSLYLKVTGQTPEQLFPALREFVEHAGN